MAGEAADTRERHRGLAAPARKGPAPAQGTGQQRFCHWHPVLLCLNPKPLLCYSHPFCYWHLVLLCYWHLVLLCYCHPVLPSGTIVPSPPGTPSRAKVHIFMYMYSTLGVSAQVVFG